jgi:prepilin-type N-terminal cleavage/methylation domain-containing protein
MDMRMDSAPSAAEREHKKRGFTLTEIAIVLGIIGLILGAIWVAAAAVYTNMRVARSSQELLQITQSIRSLYATSTVTGGTDGGDITASLIPAGVFPTDSLPTGASSTIVNSPWNGATIHIFSDSITAAGTGDGFVVQFKGVPPQGCINLAVSSTGSGRDPGMIAAEMAPSALATDPTAAPAATTTSATYYYLVGSTSGVPATAAAAATACGNGAASTVGFLFRLRV